MMEESIFKAFRTWFWNPDVWLMPGVSWEDVKPTPENGYPNTDDLIPYTIALSLGFVILRYFILEPMIVKPIGRSLGLKEHSCKKPPHCAELETIFLKNSNSKIDKNMLADVTKQIGWSERQVERWFRYRKASEKSSDMFKLTDCSWQLFYYTFYCIYGIYVLHDEPWFWDIKLCWTNFPFQSIPNELWWYYMIPLGYYTNMSLTFMFQHKRKDSLQMFLHHILSMALIILSFSVNMVRAGSLILVVHEVADIPLLTAKICGYVGMAYLMDYLFVVFILLWITTRLFLFPFWILKNSIFEAHIILDTMYPIYYIFNGLLLLLLGFHIIWTYLIIQTLVRKLRSKKIVQDVRSDSDEILEDEVSQPFPNSKED